MTNYTKSTNFTSKDSLASGNPLKIVKGTEIDAEFNNIVTAIGTKADLLSPTFTGTPLAPTAASGTFNTQLATTAFVLQAIYPVGSIYINASVSTNPATLFGFGTWVAFGVGQVAVGLNGSDGSFNTLGQTGGSKDSTLPSHTHSASSSSSVTDPGHKHQYYLKTGTASGPSAAGNESNGYLADTTTSTTGISVSTSTLTLTTGATSTISATVSPANATNQNVI